jgi:hypothetical protein
MRTKKQGGFVATPSGKKAFEKFKKPFYLSFKMLGRFTSEIVFSKFRIRI